MVIIIQMDTYSSSSTGSCKSASKMAASW